MSAGYTPGVPRLGVPALLSSDASLGITNPGYRPDDKGATALPASIVVGSSFNPRLAREGGAMLGREARIRGFNVMLAGGINLARDVRNGRNFEYYSEDPLAQRRARRRGRQRHPGRGGHLDAQALHAQLQRDQPSLAGRDHRSGRAPRVRSARFPDRDRALAARLDHDRLQQDQRRVCRREPPPAQRSAQGRLGLQGLGDVRLGRRPRVGLRAQGARSGIRHPDGREAVGLRGVHRTAEGGLCGRQAAQGAPLRHGAPHPALDVRGRASTSGGRRPKWTWRSTTRWRSKSPGRASCC